MKIFKIDLTPEEAFQYGSVIASGIAGFIFYFKRYMKNKKNRKEKNNCADCGLCEHKLFAMLKIWIREVNHPNWKCCNEYKTRVGRKMITEKLTVGIEYLQKAFCKLQHEPVETLLAKYKEEILTMVDIYVYRWEMAGINPKIIKQINDYHNMNVRYALRLAETEFSRNYQDTKEIIRNVLNTLIIPYSMFILDVRNVLDSANGDLLGDSFEGVVNTNEVVKIDLHKMRMSFLDDEQ